MTEEQLKDFQNLPHGLYKIFYFDDVGGGYSLASVGSTYSGKRWYAPCNWTSAHEHAPLVASTEWKSVHHVELVEQPDHEDSQKSGQY